MPRRHACWLSLTVILAGVACGCAGPPPLADTVASLDTLAEAVVEGLSRRDEAALRRLAVSEEEFRERIWPELPVSRPERNVPFYYVWGDLRQKSDASLRLLLAAHGGRRLQVAAVNRGRNTTQYDSFLLHADVVVRVRDETGEEEPMRLFGSVIETADGRFKIYSYIVDD
jgi:hypothetical protein